MDLNLGSFTFEMRNQKGWKMHGWMKGYRTTYKSENKSCVLTYRYRLV